MVADHHAIESCSNGQSAGDGANRGPSTSPPIDRLVTGDLDEAERLDLLAWLDAEPARWRRCGLAFLEAQALREALALGAERSIAPARASAQRPRRTMFAAVAAAMLAFVLGWAAGHRATTPDDHSGLVASGGSPEEASDPASQSTASQDAASVRTSSLGPTPFPAPGGRVALVHLRVGDGPGAREVLLPVLAVPPGDTSWDHAPGPIPDYVRQQWERQGYRVTERRQAVPLKLADGRQIDIPVEQVMLTFVGQPLL
jgi:hypothetical protein